jgi:hypothetical protein
MAARYDKYDPVSGGFRATLAVAVTATSGAGSTSQIGIPLGVGLDANGRLVIGAGTTGVVGVCVFDSVKAIGDVADVMTAGEIVDLDSTAFTVGNVYYAAATGAVNTTNTGARTGIAVRDQSVTTGVAVPRLVVRFTPLGTDA